jgi:uncharacterized protein (TIGR03086 family)
MTQAWRWRSPESNSRKRRNAMKLTGWDVLDEARTMLVTAVAGVTVEGLELATPCAEWNVAQVLQHAALDQIVWASALSGTAMPSENPFAPSGQLNGAPLAYVSQALDSSVSAWAAIGTELVPTPLPQGKMAASQAAGAAALDAAIHAWDIAVATGQGSPLTPQLAKLLHPVATGIVEPLRQYGAYAAALTPAPGADPAAALLCYLGRQPVQPSVSHDRG